MLNVVHVGGGSEISCRRQRAIASAGLSHSLWLVSPASWIGVWPSGARATKKRRHPVREVGKLVEREPQRFVADDLWKRCLA
jgi:hypothetical protein